VFFFFFGLKFVVWAAWYNCDSPPACDGAAGPARIRSSGFADKSAEITNCQPGNKPHVMRLQGKCAAFTVTKLKAPAIMRFILSTQDAPLSPSTALIFSFSYPLFSSSSKPFGLSLCLYKRPKPGQPQKIVDNGYRYIVLQRNEKHP